MDRHTTSGFLGLLSEPKRRFDITYDLSTGLSLLSEEDWDEGQGDEQGDISGKSQEKVEKALFENICITLMRILLPIVLIWLFEVAALPHNISDIWDLGID